MNFLKMQGLGNDFILTHEVSAGTVQSVARQAVKLCDRRRGIGADGIIFVLPSQKADLKMRIINSDGSEAEMCGNGIRCFSLYVKLLNLNDIPQLSIETPAGIIRTEFIDEDHIRVNMGRPVLDASRIPVAGMTGWAIRKELVIDDKSFIFTAVSMGNPHVVIYSEELTDELVLGYGPKIECHPLFPKKTNVEFIKVLSDKEIAMRVWERGCGETQACGTGACASVVSGILSKLHGNDITVHLPGGKLHVNWSGSDNDPVFMTGPATKVFEGHIDLNL
ncbi:MAG TPA: diaminopimelate epimerase [Chitinispirillaceae bacterium]|jgi:diaminopimelate epimerase|nr:diaminopimelate epimerase [Chitinispirillaceae bacterium]